MAKAAAKKGAAKKRLIILDTHAILHRAFHAIPDFSSSKGIPTGGLYGLISILVKIINDLKPDYIAAAIDLPGGTFRHAVYEEYKGTRAELDEALVSQLKRAPEVLMALGIPVYSAKGYEADDVIGTIVEKLKNNKEVDLVIASGDMDTMQLVDKTHVRVFTMRKGLTDVVLYNEEAVRERYGFGPEGVPDLKGLAGDPSDNIKGVAGVGAGSAMKLLAVYGNLKELYAALRKEGVEKVAEKTGVQKRFVQLVADNKKEAEFSKELATIRRDAPIDFALPKKSWREGVDVPKTLDMLAEYDFRTLIPRVKQILGSAEESKVEEGSDGTSRKKVLGTSSLERGQTIFSEISVDATISPAEFHKAAIAVSVLDSNITTPDLDDILRMGRASEFAEAYKNLLEEIKSRKLEFIYEQVELPLSPVLRRMEERGVMIDKQFLIHLSKDYTKELERIAKRIYAHAGSEFNIGSPKQLGDILFDTLGLAAPRQKKTAGGQRSTRESELIKLKGAHPIIDDILAYRELSKLLGTYIDTIPTQLDKHNRLHTSYIQIGAATGRIASKDPNLQNIPIKTELGRRIRHAFVATPGMQLVSFDYSQIELRIAAILSEDESLMDIFKKGRDVHTEVAARVFHVKEGEVTHEQRRRAKVINFGLLYGMGVNALQQGLGTNRAEAQNFYEQYLEAFPRLAAYIDEVKADAARLGYTQTLFGRRRYFDGIKSKIPFVRAAAERMAINAPMQGTQADLIKLAMVEIGALLEKEKGEAYMLLQVHDELVFEIEDKKVKEYAPKIKEIMERVMPKAQTKGVPIIAEGKAGPNWGQMERIEEK